MNGALGIELPLGREETVLRASRHRLAATAAAGLREAGVARGERLCLLVSGGADSLAMLVLMAAIRERTDRSLEGLSVLSVDHGLRPAAVAECAHAVAVARALGVGHAVSVRVRVDAGGNILDAARRARMAAVAAHCAAHGIGTAVLAHHADDLAESVLIGLGRGAGLASLASLLPRREFAGDGGKPYALARPLLGARRAELRGFLEELGIAWCEDPANALHARGRLRSDPSLAGLVDEIAAGAFRLCEEAQDLIMFRDSELDALLAACSREGEVSRAALDALAPHMVRPFLRRFARVAGAEIPLAAVGAIAGAIDAGERSPKSFDCAGGARVALDARGLRIERGAGPR